MDDGCFMNQDEICRKKSPGRKDNTFCLKHVAFEVFVWHLNISAINNISYIKKIAWVCWYRQIWPFGHKEGKKSQCENPDPGWIVEQCLREGENNH